MIQGGLLLWYNMVKLLQRTPKTCKRFNAFCWNEGLAAQMVQKGESCKGPPKTSFKLDVVVVVVVRLQSLVNIMSRSVLGRGSLVNIELLVLQKPGNFMSQLLLSVIFYLKGAAVPRILCLLHHMFHLLNFLAFFST